MKGKTLACPNCKHHIVFGAGNRGGGEFWFGVKCENCKKRWVVTIKPEYTVVDIEVFEGKINKDKKILGIALTILIIIAGLTLFPQKNSQVVDDTIESVVE